MDIQLLNNYFNTQTLQGGFWNFYLDMTFTAFLSLILSRIYIKYGNSLSNRKSFATNFITLSLTTMFIITVVKSSLALSLGLVGALSIVRFRSAIKKPEELAYLFLSISLGLGFGSGQRYISVISFAFIAAIIILKGLSTRSNKEQNLFLNISSKETSKLNVEKVVDVLKPHTSLIKLRRIDKTNENVDIILYVKFSSIDKLNKAEKSLRSIDNNIRLSFIEDKGVFN